MLKYRRITVPMTITIFTRAKTQVHSKRFIKARLSRLLFRAAMHKAMHLQSITQHNLLMTRLNQPHLKTILPHENIIS
jgi:hypothetical protein